MAWLFLVLFTAVVFRWGITLIRSGINGNHVGTLHADCAHAAVVIVKNIETVAFLVISYTRHIAETGLLAQVAVFRTPDITVGRRCTPGISAYGL